jgi:hypothetical protein
MIRLPRELSSAKGRNEEKQAQNSLQFVWLRETHGENFSKAARKQIRILYRPK